MESTLAVTSRTRRRLSGERTNTWRRRKHSRQANTVRQHHSEPILATPYLTIPRSSHGEVRHRTNNCIWEWSSNGPESFPSIEWCQDLDNDRSHVFHDTNSSFSREEFGLHNDSKLNVADQDLWVDDALHRLGAVSLDSGHMHRSMAFLSNLNFLEQPAERYPQILDDGRR